MGIKTIHFKFIIGTEAGYKRCSFRPTSIKSSQFAPKTRIAKAKQKIPKITFKFY